MPLGSCRVVGPLASHLRPLASHLRPLASHLRPLASCLIPLTSRLLPLVVSQDLLPLASCLIQKNEWFLSLWDSGDSAIPTSHSPLWDYRIFFEVHSAPCHTSCLIPLGSCRVARPLASCLLSCRETCRLLSSLATCGVASAYLLPLGVSWGAREQARGGRSSTPSRVLRVRLLFLARREEEEGDGRRRSTSPSPEGRRRKEMEGGGSRSTRKTPSPATTSPWSSFLLLHPPSVSQRSKRTCRTWLGSRASSFGQSCEYFQVLEDCK